VSNSVPTAVNQADLAEHADAIRELHKRVAGDVIEIGRRLTECKSMCGHGQWLRWLDREFQWTDDTALNFMRVYELARKSRNFRDLSLPISALYLLAAPSTPETARAECFKRVGAGEVIQFSEVKRVVEKHKNDTTPATHRAQDVSAIEVVNNAVPPPRDDDGEGDTVDAQLGALLRAWGRASEDARRKFAARVGLVEAPTPPN